jgi:hypothetical protein
MMRIKNQSIKPKMTSMTDSSRVIGKNVILNKKFIWGLNVRVVSKKLENIFRITNKKKPIKPKISSTDIVSKKKQ